MYCDTFNKDFLLICRTGYIFYYESGLQDVIYKVQMKYVQTMKDWQIYFFLIPIS